MKVKKFIAPTMPEVMQKVRKDLGADAVILNSKVIHQGGFLGLFKKKNIEVIAALDKQPHKPQPEKKPVLPEASKEKPNQNPNTIPNPRSVNTEDGVLKEIRDLKKWMELNTASQLPDYPVSYQLIYQHFLQQGIDDDKARQLVDGMVQEQAEPERSSESYTNLLSNQLEKSIQAGTFGGINYDKQFVHLVGPTGVGKTTTIAKIAANSVLKENKKVAFITTDTYRIAAIDQLKTYSKILDIPMEIAYNLEDYNKARQKFEDYDLVLVDTAGRNFRDEKYVKELGEIIDLDRDIDTYLVLSLTTKSSDLKEIYNQFKNVPLKQLIFTKKDETSTFGAMVNLCLEAEIGIAYITTGQDVPDDIEGLSPRKIAELIVGDYGNE
ncbi:flagellar biosynthesis protein FlhF [Sediminibacillus albus]|uniref:Flagellar biosynthesis protein FlhF n=1 Tax=Sediminibacillus albus TaxID=407036 RepID=A0A1G8W1Z0_9BACI|nr:flagellar biosynthesis protein FlhF [Sediminibacillus albus]SDJ72083.1 flagellar biosynthesis protein FlhF [Sediminibacillus albus]